MCGKALEPDEDELEQQKQHFTGQAEAGKTPIQGPPGQQPQEQQKPQQPKQEPGKAAAEGKEAELSGGEKIAERREGGQQQPQSGQQQPQKQRRYLIHEFPGTGETFASFLSWLFLPLLSHSLLSHLSSCDQLAASSVRCVCLRMLRRSTFTLSHHH